MKFIKTQDSVSGAAALLEVLTNSLQMSKKVLWLISGGSAIASEVNILKALQVSNLTKNLTIMLMDERYGRLGHPDSNWQQLLNAGVDFSSSNSIPVLNNPQKSLQQTAADYAKQTVTQFAAADVIIGLFGIGPDGHTAGILPGSPATYDTAGLVVGYNTPQFDRVTMTRAVLAKIDIGYVFAFGDAKRPALLDLRAGTKTFSDLPAKLLQDLPNCYIYNDQIGETS